MTPANEKMSASLLYDPRSSKISGAIRHAFWLPSTEALRIELSSWVTIDSPKSVIRAWPAASTRIFD